jgi:hypothetical protein
MSEMGSRTMELRHGEHSTVFDPGPGRDYRNRNSGRRRCCRATRDAVTFAGGCAPTVYACKYPVLIAASPHPRQIENLAAPAGFIEAGAADFSVPGGYVHVIANCRGTSWFRRYLWFP